MNKPFDSGLMWFRRDLRLIDNAALCLALAACRQLHCVFVSEKFDAEDKFIRRYLPQLAKPPNKAIHSN